MASLSDGAIVGSAIIKILAQYGREATPYVGEYVRSMTDALRGLPAFKTPAAACSPK